MVVERVIIQWAGECELYFSCRMGLPTGHKPTGPDDKAPLQVDVGCEIGFWLTAYGEIFGSRQPERFLGGVRVV